MFENYTQVKVELALTSEEELMKENPNEDSIFVNSEGVSIRGWPFFSRISLDCLHKTHMLELKNIYIIFFAFFLIIEIT